MKNKFTAVVLTLSMMVALPMVAQQPNFEWASGFGGTASSNGQAIATDTNGNVYTTGYYQGTVDFDPGPGTYTLSEAGSGDVFVSKTDANGNLVWARSIGGASFEEATSIAADPNGNVYVCGRYYSTVFNPGSTSFTLGNVGSDDMFICKFSSSGNLQWARGIGSTGIDAAFGITADANGNACFTGLFSGTVDFNPGAGVYNVTAIGLQDIFIYKMDALGSMVWVNTFGIANNGLSGSKITVDAIGNIYTCGYYSGGVDFDPGPSSATLAAPGGTDLYVAKYSPSGAYIWARGFNGGSGVKYISGIAVDANNNVFTTGSFNTIIDFDPGSSTYTIAPAGLDIFVSKLDNNGNFVWANGMGGANQDYGIDLASDASGNIYVTGLFAGTADFNPGAAVYTLAANGNDDAYVTKLDNAGNFIFAYSFGNGNSDQVYGISVQADNIHLTGSFSGVVDFNPGAGTYTISSILYYDVFVHKMSQCFAPATPVTPGGNQACAGSGVHLSATSGTATINWFSTLTATSSIASGTNFVSSSTLSPGVYTLYAEAQSCTVSAARTAISFTVLANPPVTAGGSSVICVGETANLTAAGAATYTWNTGLSGSVIAVSPNSQTSYTVMGTSNNGCTNAAALTLNVDACTGITNRWDAGTGSIELYPNPAQSKLHIVLQNVNNHSSLTVFNLAGQSVMTKDLTESVNTIDVSELSSGIYLIQINQNSQTLSTKKFVKH